MMKRSARRAAMAALLLVMGMSLLAGCAQEAAKPKAEAKAAGTAKYVFLFIGDGMGLPQRAAQRRLCGHQTRH